MGGTGAGGGQGPGVTGREPAPGDEGLSPWFTAGARATGDGAARPGRPGQPGQPAEAPSGPPPGTGSHRRRDPSPQPPYASHQPREPYGSPEGAPPRRPAPRGMRDTAVLPVIEDAPVAPATPVVPDFPAAEPDPVPAPVPQVPPGPGRAERRRAAAAAAKKGRGRGRQQNPVSPDGTGTGTGTTTGNGTGNGIGTGTGGEASARPLTRVEARRAARAAKDSPAVIASRAMGELFITCGVLMLLFVTYQLWWTNVRAGMEAGKERDRIEQSFKDEKRKPGAFRPGEGFAIMYIPKLDVVVPVAEGIDKKKVLDRGMAGHYAEGSLKTAMPSDPAGNFGVAGHRNTHGEPFRYINRLKPGDPIVVETRDAYYTYEMASILPETSPSNVAVLDPVPRGSGFTKPGRYITLTTCTPEFTSTYRMIVWGTMVEERPRSKGKPDALVG
ncbi:class E sortase [Streptomyces sp. NPDC058953]|uniref:class E sortase n=1 Tax=unclassified Streptomyces TaxID=2593676 RepID=UPI003679EC16